MTDQTREHTIMTSTPVERMAELTSLYLAHRDAGTQIEELPENLVPHSLEEAYQVQAAVAARIPGGTAGWKIGMTNRAAMQTRGMDTPVYARLFTDTTWRDGSAITAAVGGRQMLEAEYVFELDHDIAPGTYAREELATYIRAVRPGIEICGSRFSTMGGLDLGVSLADNSFHRGLVVGEPIEGWLDRYLDEAVVIDVDNGQKAEGSGRSVLDDPLIPFTWLSSIVLPDGGLRAGDLVATGAAATVILETRQVKAVARFGDDIAITAELR